MNARKFNILGLLFISFSILGVAAVADTPDGATPPNEDVCDGLMAEGVTTGLYGLCIAFCEARDFAELSTPISNEELLSLEENAPSGKILTAYRKMKNDSDPAMPCIAQESSCPCWTEAELASIDGIMNDGYTPTGSHGGFDAYNDLQHWENTYYSSDAYPFSFRQHNSAAVFKNYQGELTQCVFISRDTGTDEPTISRHFGISQGSISLAELATCEKQLRTSIQAHGH